MIAGPLAAQQSGLGGPVLGYLLDGEGHVRPLIGPAGSAYLASPLAAEVALREWVGRYGLDQEGQLYFGSGVGDLRRVETKAGWRNLIGSSRPDVALVRSGGRVAIVRTGVAGAAFELGMDVQHLAIDSYGEAIAGADSERVALWRADGSMVFQTPLAEARALQVLPHGAGLCGLAESFFVASEDGRLEMFDGVRGSALGLTRDGSAAVILSDEGRKVRVFTVASREWREEEAPVSGRRLTPLHDGRTFLLTGDAGEPSWTLTVRAEESSWAQIPLLRGGQN
jgi:hypothetical protein